MTQPDTIRPSRADRWVKRVAEIAVRWLYRSVEVYAAPDAPIDGPVMAVSNHFGGLADPLLLMHASPRVPRIIARDKIWKIPIARSIMKAIGAIPVHKREDHAGSTSNEEMFSSAHAALDKGELLLIFPEGVTVDDPSIAHIKTGAARIALGARAAGTEGVQILPAGIHYEDKAALRSRVFINIGYPMDLDAEVGEFPDGGDAPTPENRTLVRALTDDIEERLRTVAPDFSNWDEARRLTQAAEVAVRAYHDGHPEQVSVSERDRLAGQLGRADETRKQAVIESVTSYDQDLDAVGLTDAQAYEQLRTGKFLGYVMRSVLVGLVLLPFALIGISLNLIPLLLIGAIGLLRVSPAVKATMKPAAAILFFPITWAVVAWQIVFDRAGPLITIIAILLIPLYLVAAILLTERIVLLWRAFKDWRGNKNLAQAEDEINAGRQSVIDAVAVATR